MLVMKRSFNVYGEGPGNCMASKIIRSALVVLAFIGMISFGFGGAIIPVRARADNSVGGVGIQKVQTGPVYFQPIDPNGKLILSARLEPDGSDYDEFVWDDFTLAKDGTITAINWYGGYDPLKFGKGGPVMDFTVSIYPSTASGREPAVANLPLAQYQTSGNANETAFDVFNGNQINAYSFDLPTPFIASADVKYWVYIVASQQGSLPDWCFIAGTGGSGNHYTRTSGAGGDIMYRLMPGDVAMTLLGSTVDTGTPTPTTTVIAVPSDTPAPTPTPIPQQVPTCFGSVFTFIMLMVFFLEFKPTKF